MQQINILSLAVVTLLGIIAYLAKRIVDKVESHSTALTELTIAVTGKSGSNGLVGDIKLLRERSHEHANTLHGALGKIALVEQRVDQLEAR